MAVILVIPKDDHKHFPQVYFSLLSQLLLTVFVYSQSISLLRRLQPDCTWVRNLVCWTAWLTTETPDTLSKPITGSTLNATALKIISSRFTLKFAFSPGQQDSCEFLIFSRPFLEYWWPSKRDFSHTGKSFCQGLKLSFDNLAWKGFFSQFL